MTMAISCKAIKAIKAINMLQLQTSLHSTSFISVVISCLSWHRGDLTTANVTFVPYNTWGYMRNVLKKRVRFISRETGRYATNIALPVNLIVKLVTKLDKNTKNIFQCHGAPVALAVSFLRVMNTCRGVMGLYTVHCDLMVVSMLVIYIYI